MQDSGQRSGGRAFVYGETSATMGVYLPVAGTGGHPGLEARAAGCRRIRQPGWLPLHAPPTGRCARLAEKRSFRLKSPAVSRITMRDVIHLI